MLAMKESDSRLERRIHLYDSNINQLVSLLHFYSQYLSISTYPAFWYLLFCLPFKHFWVLKLLSTLSFSSNFHDRKGISLSLSLWYYKFWFVIEVLSFLLAWQVYCMVMRINIDCNGCYRKVRRALVSMKGEIFMTTQICQELIYWRFYDIDLYMFFFIIELEKHLIEKNQSLVSVFGRFIPQEVAIKIRKQTNRRVEILDIEEFGLTYENQEQKPLISSWNLVPNSSQIESRLTVKACNWSVHRCLEILMVYVHCCVFRAN